MIQTSTQLIEALKNIADNYKTVYMWGTFGAPVTENLIVQKTNQYPSWYTTARQAKFRSLIDRGFFAFDCVNVIKALLWGWNGDASKSYGGAIYKANGVPDIDADTMITKCIGVSVNFADLEPGEALWTPGHIGVYIGQGKAIECTPVWKDGVQVSAVRNLGTIAGLNARTWIKHGKLPYIIYSEDEESEDWGMVYKNIDEMPEWGKPTIEKLLELGYLAGDFQGNLNIPHEILRVYVVNDRAGLYK